MSQNKRVYICGAGGMGRAVGLMLAAEYGDDLTLYIGDRFIEAAKSAQQWITNGLEFTPNIHAFQMDEGHDSDETLPDGDSGHVILDCLPGSQATRIAKLADKHGMGYVNLTEHVKETKEIEALAKTSKSTFILQAGLAPGFIDILAKYCVDLLRRDKDIEQLEYVGMKVGAIAKHSSQPTFYNFTWSPVGVATEYIKDCEVIRDGKKTNVPALSDRETIIIDGYEYEADLTSGGAANLPDYYAGQVKDLDYKTLRFKGHYDWVESELNKLSPEDPEIVSKLLKSMKGQVSNVENDLIIIFAEVTGKDQDGNLQALRKVVRVEPCYIGQQHLRAIQATTSSALAECCHMVLEGKCNGLVHQSDIDPVAFFNGPFVSKYYFNGNTPDFFKQKI